MTAYVGNYNPQKLLDDILQKLVERGALTPEEAKKRQEKARASWGEPC
ncbi:MAG: hypothetical protein Q8O40_15580 [Chloroflexota bacterium]|nr:hypothetical protein [Chloroflexota bacterium]